MPTRPRISVEPSGHAWTPALHRAVEAAGGRLVPATQAEGLVWLGKEGVDLRDHVHEGTRWVQLPAAGVEYWLGTGEIDDRRIFTSAGGAYARTVGEHAIALMFAVAKNLHRCARLRAWDEEAAMGQQLRGATVGIIGAGAIGRELIGYLQPFGVETLAVTRSGRKVPGATSSLASSDLGTVWPLVDFAVLLAPATADTKHLVGPEVFAAMKRTAWIINLARGMLVDTDALVDAVRAGTIGGAALDVTDPEPLPNGHPLWEMENVLITPHTANPKRGQEALLAEHVTCNIRRFADGVELLAVVDLDAGY